jgi:hypothetical protein
VNRGGFLVESIDIEAEERFVLWSKSSESTREGSVLDIDTGILRRDHVLRLRSPQSEITLGLGAIAGALIDFAENGETFGEPLLEISDKADQAIRRDDFAKSHALGVPAVVTTIDDPMLRRLALLECFLEKASPDDPIRPGWPAGTPGSLGGKFMPKDRSPGATEATEQKLKRLKALREFRAAAQAALVVLQTAPLEGVPGVDVLANIKAAVDLARIAIELGNDETEINEALDFVKTGPYTLDQLRVSQEDRGFETFDAFKKVPPVVLFFRAYGSAPPGNEYHHIVEQGGDNATNLPADELHSTKNIVQLPGPLHDLVTAEYAKEYDDSGKSTREWLQGQSFDDQWNEGVKILRDLGIVK